MILTPMVPFTKELEERGVTVISNPIVPLTLELEEQGGKSDIKPHGAIDF